MSLKIALYQPDIPANTGTIIRMAACLGLGVEIIHPAGFDLSNRSLRRAGMDYIEMASLNFHLDFKAFHTWCYAQSRRLILFSSKADLSYTEFSYSLDDILMFGRESAGVPDNVRGLCNHCLVIPLVAGRSLNLAVSAAMVAGEAVRQLKS